MHAKARAHALSALAGLGLVTFNRGTRKGLLWPGEPRTLRNVRHGVEQWVACSVPALVTRPLFAGRCTGLHLQAGILRTGAILVHSDAVCEGLKVVLQVRKVRVDPLLEINHILKKNAATHPWIF